MSRVRTPIIRRPRPLASHRRADRYYTSTAKSPESAGCDDLGSPSAHAVTRSRDRTMRVLCCACLEAALSKSVLTNACAAYPVVEVLRFLGQAYDT